jgi:hypothetical protein
MKTIWFRKYLTTAVLTAAVVVALEAAASYPTAIKSFTTKIAGDTVQPSHINDLQDEVSAIETQLITSGTWTMTLVSSGGGTPTYTDRTGYYLRVGSVMHVTGILTLATTGTLAAGSLTITGLPVASKNVTGNYAAVTIPYWQTLTTSMVHMGGYVAPNTATITLVRAAAAAASTAALTVADISGTTQIIVSSTYVVQ